MHTLYARADPIPTLYVRSLSGYAGPEASLSAIFSKARQQAPCFLVFEDLDSIVTDAVRSYFLNEVDGLRNNDGILMVGSTNHLERLDPGISKRPSRFDRKYLFPDPSMDQRVQYCEYWRTKLLDNEDIEFPTILNKAIASITKGFSFAYIQEAFVAALLAIANADDDNDNDNDDESEHEDEVGHDSESDLCYGRGRDFCGGFDPCNSWDHLCTCGKSRVGCWKADGLEKEEDLEKYVLWREIKKVIKTLREELKQDGKGSRVGVRGQCGAWRFE
jgi:transitional endoplasmic reticulum ATPase